MKRLTINRLAGAGIRANRKNYLSLCTGIFASIFLVCSVVLSVFAAYAGYLDRFARENGKQEAIAFDVADTAAQKLMQQGLVQESGFVTIVGVCNGFGVGYYDEAANSLAYRQMFSGRMPQAPGEIAAELDALDKVAPDAEPGDVIRLTVTPIDGTPEEREFTLTGIVIPQWQQLNNFHLQNSPDARAYAPQLFISPGEPTFSTGSPLRNLYLTFGKNASLDDIAAALGDSTGLIGFAPDGWVYVPGEVMITEDPLSAFLNHSSALPNITILGGSLLIFALFGIAAALDSQLERKKEEIGMLRAVGATKRQIRKIFGRESLLLALILSPMAVAASVLFVYGLCRLAPKTFCFFLPPLAILLMLVLSLLFILGASFIPLWRSAKQRPMGILRDTQSLRRAKRIHSRSHFHPTVLVPLRKLRLHPLRYLSGGILTAMLCVTAFMAVFLGADAAESLSNQEKAYDYYIYQSCWSGFGDLRTPILQNRLSDADLDQLRTLPHVQSVGATWQTGAILDLTEPGDYLEQCGQYDIFIVPARADGLDYQAAEAILHPEGKLCYLSILVTDDPEQYADFLTAGQIRREALDAGQEVLFCAPEYYLKKWESRYVCSSGIPADGIYDLHFSNDTIHVGQTLSLAQLTADPDISENEITGNTLDDFLRAARKAELHRGTTQVGGILCALEQGKYGYSLTEPTIVTTPQGLEAMGLLHSEISGLTIYLDGDVDEDTEAYLENRITRIAHRGKELEVVNQLEMNRENRNASRNVLLICGCTLALFLWISVSIISGSSVRQMQAEKKTIGTLRALGMDGKRLISGYTGQAAVTVLLGLALALPISFLIDPGKAAAMGVTSEACIAALVLLLCRWQIGKSGKALLRGSVIDNIREA